MSVSAEPRPPGRRGSTDLLRVEDVSAVPGPPQALSLRDPDDFIPQEILQVLISSGRGAEKPQMGQIKKPGGETDGKVSLRPTDPVWHHPLRRARFKHLTEQPVCVSGAGRDISFLCDALVMEKKNTAAAQLTSRSDKSPRTMDREIEESLVPSEFYIVKNKGVLGLEYYEDKYTTLLEDDERRLRVFPSMKPSGRAEVIQLMKVMDTMLKQAGIDEEDVKLEGPTQIHNLLELLKTEQNIYNVVFHELIRQVSVECVERGELLAKLRQRYVMLLSKIPQQLLSLYNDLLAQRALDRSLTQEIIYFKNSIGELTEELYQVREHDLRVSRDAKQAQAELAKALTNAKKNANLLEEYRELYELQRSRLERQLLHLTEERDLWSSATYRLARKDTKDLCEIQQITERWRDHISRFQRDLQRSEESSREKLQMICTDLRKWQQHLRENVFVDWCYRPLPEEDAAAILQDVKNWEHMLTEEQQRFEGHNVLSGQESLKVASDIHKEWSQLGEKLLRRHEGLDGRPAPEHPIMEDLTSAIEELTEKYRRRVEGENGVAQGLASLSGSLTSWSSPVHPLTHTPNEIRESDWSVLYQLLPEWSAQVERILELIAGAGRDETTGEITDRRADLEDVLKRLQHWVLSTTNGTDRDDLQLTQQVTDLHTAMVQYLVNALMLLSPDYSADPADAAVVAGFEEEVFPAMVPVQQMQEEAVTLSEKLHSFSSYIIKCCQEMVESGTVLEDDGYQLRQLHSIQSLCNEWVETCRLLLSKVTDYTDPPETAEDSQTREDQEVVTRVRKPEVTETAAQDIMRIIDYDGNIAKKSLKDEEIRVSPQGALTAIRPATPRSIQAFHSLSSLEQLEQRLLDAELRAQKAEERSESLEEELRAALQKIQELEVRCSAGEENREDSEDPAAPADPKSETLGPPAAPPKKRPKSTKSKLHK
ncbi:axonemal dynein light chain domain-containing protein 1 isoform X2 [Dendropsophus ebraccatus]|uniref:axonemal dynein light chain domain-containing protein 1 isoform X2 n=1 Tax=Dendropsophus ebraccatus TaxID=150705 RepID=UPI00383107F8